MKRNDSDILKARIFCDPALPANTVSDVTPAVRLDAHVQLCASCQGALDVPSPQPSCVTRLCGDGFALLAAALTESGRFAAGLAVQVAS